MDDQGSSVAAMEWWDYVQHVTGGIPNAHIAEAIDITAPSVGRWRRGSKPDPQQAATFARVYKRPVLEAFLAAGFLTPEEAQQRPSAAPSLAELTDDELLVEVAHRMRRGGTDASTAEAGKKSRDEIAALNVVAMAAQKGRGHSHRAGEDPELDEVPDWARDAAAHTSSEPKGRAYNNQEQES